MGLRFRRTLKIAPGLRLNFNKNSVGLSIGPRGAKYTINSSGRRTASVGIPGSGLYYTESTGGGRRKTETEFDPLTRVDEHGNTEHIDIPGLFAGRAETIFFEFAEQFLVSDSNFSFDEIKAAAENIKTTNPEIAPFIDYVMIAKTANVSAQEALALCERLYAMPDLLTDKIAKKYFDQFRANIPIARGISFSTDYNHSYLTYTYSEILQALGQPQKALEIISKAPDSEYKNIDILDLRLALKEYETVIDETNDLENEDDQSAILLIFRAIAYRELKEFDLAIETLRIALSKRTRPNDILAFARYERAVTYVAMGKKAQAIKDLNTIIAKDYTDEEAKKLLKELDS